MQLTFARYILNSNIIRRILVAMPNLGDYHYPRMNEICSLCGEQNWDFKLLVAMRSSKFYAHTQRRARFFPHLPISYASSSSGFLRWLNIILNIIKFRPTHVFVLGYQSPSSIIIALLGIVCSYKTFFYSDSKFDDGPRDFVKELCKRTVLPIFNGALVAGIRHKAYLRSLGFRNRQVEIAYDVVDSTYFKNRAARYFSKQKLIPDIFKTRYILVVARLVERKRIDRAIDIFIRCLPKIPDVNLVIIGLGPLESMLKKSIFEQDMAEKITIVRDVDNMRMALYYKYASLVMLTSEYDQWGLCINESISCGTPALVTKRCGCAEELVHSNFNGYVWDADKLNDDDACAFVIKLFVDLDFSAMINNNLPNSLNGWDLSAYKESTKNLCVGS